MFKTLKKIKEEIHSLGEIAQYIMSRIEPPRYDIDEKVFLTTTEPVRHVKVIDRWFNFQEGCWMYKLVCEPKYPNTYGKDGLFELFEARQSELAIKLNNYGN